MTRQTPNPAPPSPRVAVDGRPWRHLLALAVLLAVCGGLTVWTAPSLTEVADRALGLRALAAAEMADPWRLLAVLGLYACLLAIPFVPGAEIGFLLLVLFGAPMAAPVYGATVAGLLLAYLIGRLVPRDVLERALARLSLGGLPDVAERIAATDGPVASRGPILARLLRWRCCVLIVLVNTPGNTVLGGGGGIAMAAGMSGLFGLPRFLASIAVAVAPVPAFVFLTGLWT